MPRTCDFFKRRATAEVLTPFELIEGYAPFLGAHLVGVRDRIREGASLGSALVHERVPMEIRQELLGHYVSEELAASLDRH